MEGTDLEREEEIIEMPGIIKGLADRKSERNAELHRMNRVGTRILEAA